VVDGGDTIVEVMAGQSGEIDGRWGFCPVKLKTERDVLSISLVLTWIAWVIVWTHWV